MKNKLTKTKNIQNKNKKMLGLNFKHEKKLFNKGYKFIAGLDEAGRGSWAGPIVAGAVILDPRFKIKGIRDSKKLSPKKREELFLLITKNALAWSVGIVDNNEIDNSGIIPANRMVFEKAVKKLNVQPDYLLVDGIRNFESNIHNDFIIKADDKILSVAAASIIAKVTRDRLLDEYHKQYPEYGFTNHKGYGTKEHLEAIKKHGPTEIHRMSYKPLSELFNI